MPRQKLDLPTMKATRFEGATRDLLVRAHETLLGYPPQASDSDDVVRDACARAAGCDAGAPTVATTLPPHLENVLPARSPLGRIPNLRPHGTWEGRKRRISLQQITDASPNVKAVSISWEGQRWPIKFGEVVDAPWPYFEAAKNAVKRGFRKTFTNDEETGVLQCETKEWEDPVFMINDMGDTPGTENLPRDYMEHFQRLARTTAIFKDYKRPMLIQVFNLLNGETAASAFDSKDELQLRMMIARSLGPEFDDLINAELYEAA